MPLLEKTGNDGMKFDGATRDGVSVPSVARQSCKMENRNNLREPNKFMKSNGIREESRDFRWPTHNVKPLKIRRLAKSPMGQE